MCGVTLLVTSAVTCHTKHITVKIWTQIISRWGAEAQVLVVVRHVGTIGLRQINGKVQQGTAAGARHGMRLQSWP
jgi:hypothetical protein